jgi:uncharacterized integral membrane protein (TIGR00698 family)
MVAAMEPQTLARADDGAPQNNALGDVFRGARKVAPGLLLAASLAATALLLRRLPGVSTFSPMIISIALGMGLHNTIGAPAWAKPGMTFSLKRLLRLAIIMLGLQLTASQVAEVGLQGAAILAVCLVATFWVTVQLGRLLGVERKLAQLIAAGTSICGASAVIAANVVAEGSDEDAAYAVACVTVFGSVAMFLYPMLPGLLHLDARAFGLWSGASIHEIAQVVAAAFQDGPDAGRLATVAKLTRVMMLAPMVIALGFLSRRRSDASDTAAAGERKGPPIPWFVLGFIALVAINSLFPLPAAAHGPVVLVTSFLLSTALAAMGLETDVRKLRARGWRPLLLGLLSWLFIGGFSLALVKLTA